MIRRCPILELLEELVKVIDKEAKGEIDRFKYYEEVNDLKDRIDILFLENCPWLTNQNKESA